MSWIDYLPCTDVKREVDPEFETEVSFRYNASLSARFKQTRLRLIVFMDNGASGSIRTASGSTRTHHCRVCIQRRESENCHHSLLDPLRTVCSSKAMALAVLIHAHEYT